MYVYADEKYRLHSDEGIRAVVAVRERVRLLCAGGRRCTVGEAMSGHADWCWLSAVYWLVDEGWISIRPGPTAQDGIITLRGR